MDKQTSHYRRTTKYLRWMARIFGTLIMLFWVLTALATGMVEPSKWG